MDDNARLEGLGKEADDCAIFHNVDGKCQIKVLVIAITA